jgi:branched-chain amino acid transport system substrate-binding protein
LPSSIIYIPKYFEEAQKVFMLAQAMQKAGTVDDVAKVKTALMSFTYPGLWSIRFDKTGEEVFNFDVVDIKKGGAIDVMPFSPR